MRINRLILFAATSLVAYVETLLCTSSGSNVAWWIAYVPGFDVNSSSIWSQRSLRRWESTYKKAREVKGKTNPVPWFTRDPDEFLNVVGNQCFFKRIDKEQTEVTTNLQKRFVLAHDDWWHEAGKIPVKLPEESNMR